MRSRTDRVLGPIVSGLVLALIVFCVIRQFLGMAVGDMHTGGLYGSAGNAMMYSDY